MKPKDFYEFIIIGSGFGGSFAAYNLSRLGKEVLLIERGVSVRRDDTCWDENALHLKEHIYRGQTPYCIDQEKHKTEEEWPNDTIGGLSTFYGGAAFRLREEDFHGAPLPGSEGRDKKTAWPIKYADLASFYQQAEELQFVAGQIGEDITEPPREKDFIQKPCPVLSSPSEKIWQASIDLKLHPFHIPLAINFDGKSGNSRCILCSTCDHYLCKIEAKNDLAAVLLPQAIKFGTEILSNTRAIKINMSGGAVESVEVADQDNGGRRTIRAKNLIVSCGGLSTPHLLMVSGINGKGDGSQLIGRNLMRHANGVVSGLFPFKTNPEKCFHKQVAIPDYYFGDPEGRSKLKGALGLIQEIHTPGKGIIRENAPLGLKNFAVLSSDYLINLLCLAEDIPQLENRVSADMNRMDKFGMPALSVYHRYSPRDLLARSELYKKSKRILRHAGSLLFHITHINTFSHVYGTCRFGDNSSNSVLDPECRVWGIKNLYILDACFMPSGGAVNPSLTIAANSLRVSQLIAGNER